MQIDINAAINIMGITILKIIFLNPIKNYKRIILDRVFQ